MTIAEPFITIVIPVYNQEKYIESAVESALKQSYRHFEVLVVNDGSTDDTLSLLEKYTDNIRLIHQENKGTSAAWNFALAHTQADYLVGLDSDDELYAIALESLVNGLHQSPNVDLIYSDYEFIDDHGLITEQVVNPEAKNPVQQLLNLHDNLGKVSEFLPFGHVRFYRRQALIDVGGYDENTLYAEDFDLVLRMAENQKLFKRVPQVLYKYRWHDNNKSVLSRVEQMNDVKKSVHNYRLHLSQRTL